MNRLRDSDGADLIVLKELLLQMSGSDSDGVFSLAHPRFTPPFFISPLFCRIAWLYADAVISLPELPDDQLQAQAGGDVLRLESMLFVRRIYRFGFLSCRVQRIARSPSCVCETP